MVNNPESRPGTVSRIGRLLADALLIALLAVGVCAFFWHNGFFGHPDIQAFPY